MELYSDGTWAGNNRNGDLWLNLVTGGVTLKARYDHYVEYDNR